MFTQFLLSASFACVAALSALAAAAQMSAGSPELPKKNLVDIGGRRLNIVCIGSGSPVVVFEDGANGHMLNWQQVQAPVSAMARACFYDRAGYGFSDPSPGPMTAEAVTDDLHALLHKAGIDAPVVLVGHALGGLYATLYADRFESQVAGLVLVDPSFAGQHLQERNASRMRLDQAVYEKELARLAACADLARHGKLSLVNPRGCFRLVPGRTPDEIAYLMAQYLKPFRYESVIRESKNFCWFGANAETVDGTEEAAAARPFDNMPLLVLTAGIAPVFAGESKKTQELFSADWKAGHDRLARRSARGESVIVPGATHFMQGDKPEQVVDAIRKVIHEVRTGHPD
jgi:pimeloyl-ACP methyl ester carboxylesterase